MSFASYLVRLTPLNRVSPHYLNYLLNSSGILSVARSMALLSVNQANLNPTRYTEIRVPVPPWNEQDTIAAYLQEEGAKIAILGKRIGEAIARLRELRTALISAAVTGKIDVRSEAAS